ncbi:MAG: triple tyrosine motif-containing protein, partial [Bacteroidetes bacterium]|nr:triple tyrosine motif-containing protein [Bacteroidota bacterium]
MKARTNQTSVLLFFFMLFFNGVIAKEKGPLPGKPDHTRLYFRHLTRKEGLPSNRVYTALQDFQGYVWIATDNGLVRYDGRNMKVFSPLPGDSNSIIDYLIFNLKQARDSTLWIGTLTGISVYNPFTGRFKNIPFYGKKWKYNPVRGADNMFQDSDNSMWVATENGLIHADEKLTLYSYFPTQGSNTTTSREYFFRHIIKIIQDPRDNGKLLLATLGGLVQFNKHTGKITKDYKKIVNTNYGVVDLYLENNRFLWSCGWGTGLNCLDLKSESWKDYPVDPGIPVSITGIFPKSGEEFWLATADKGLALFSKHTGIFTFYKKNLNDEHSLLSNSIIRIIAINQDKDLWVISSEGINILNNEFCSFSRIIFPFKNYSIASYFRDKESGKFYFGAVECRGLFVWDEKNNHWDIIPPETNIYKNGISINAILKDSHKRIWLSTRDNLHYLDPVSNTLKIFRTAGGTPLRLDYPWTSCLMEDNLGNLWVGTRSGVVARIDPSRRYATYFSHIPGNDRSLIAGTRTKSLYLDRYKRVWIANDNGVSIYDPQKNYFLNNLMDSIEAFGITKRWINGIREDKLGRIWLTVDGAGLLRVRMLQPDRFSFKLFNTTNGLYNPTMGMMATDPAGDLWVINYGLLHFNPYNESFHLYDTQNGLHENITIDESLYIDDEGNIFIGNNGNFETRNINDLPNAELKIKLVLEGLEINGKLLMQDYSIKSGKRLELNENQNNMTFHYAAICFQNTDQVKFRYKLTGFDKDWVMADAAQETHYTNLPPGRYIFFVQVSNHGVWFNPSESILIVIRPFFYKTWWFLSLSGFVIIMVIFLASRYRIRQLLKLERLRTRIASDLHDEMGSTLSSISILSEISADYTENEQFSKINRQIHEGAKSLLEKIDDIIWLVYPKNDRFRNLEMRIREFAIPLFESSGLVFSFMAEESLGNLPMKMEVRRNVYLIAKECINNLVKHSRCKQVRVGFRLHSGGIVMEIEDDGLGFDPGLKTARNGLSNMKQRAIQIGGTLTITSSPGQGT